jgi:hypothetical protein
MRSLIKNDPGIQYVDEATIHRMRRRRRAFRLCIAACCIGLSVFFVVQLVQNSSPDSTSGPALTFAEPSSILTWGRWFVNSLCVNIRGAVSGTLATGNLATFLKLGICFGLGAVFLRMPQRY